MSDAAAIAKEAVVKHVLFHMLLQAPANWILITWVLQWKYVSTKLKEG